MVMRRIKTVAIVGAGTMGQGIAISCALAGYETIIFDVNTEFSEKGILTIQQTLNRSVAKGKLSQTALVQALGRISKAPQLTDVTADLVIEAVVENLEVKRTLFAELEKINRGETILASNTSSIAITQIASTLADPSRCVGLHFFNPAHLMKLVEIISGANTSPEIIVAMKEFAATLGKVAVEVKDSPGFIVNRVARHYYVESLKVLEDNVTSHEGIDRLLKSVGFKMGPFELMDLIGIDVNYAVTTSVYEGFNKAPKFRPSEIQHQKIVQGHLGKKSGKGFYDYPKN